MTENLFLKQADSYAKGRHEYPASLADKLASLTQQHERAWDVGTGNGQAAIMIAERYKAVVATDISEPQLSLAGQRPNITYSKMSATPSAEELERVVGAEGSVDLVTVAAALHWFDLDKFYPIVKHVLRKPGGVIAAFVHGMYRFSPEVDKVLDECNKRLQPYRAPQSKFVFQQYKTIPFPFEPVGANAEQRGVEVEVLEMERSMTLEGIFVLWKSSSAVQTALDQGIDLVNEHFKPAILKVWGPEKEVRPAKIPLYLLVGTVSPAFQN